MAASSSSNGAGGSSNGASAPSSVSGPGLLACSARLAAVRAAEQAQPVPLFADAYAAAALDAVQAAGAALPAALDAPACQRDGLATRFLDEQLLKAATVVNLERDLTQVGAGQRCSGVGGGLGGLRRPCISLLATVCCACAARPNSCLPARSSPRHPCPAVPRRPLWQEYNQIVLIGDAFDTRPFRLPWPEGTVLFCVAPAAAHAAAESALKAAGARVPRGCLLRRVPAELQAGQGFAAALERGGFRGDRLSVWALQVWLMWGRAEGLGGAGAGGLASGLQQCQAVHARRPLCCRANPCLHRRHHTAMPAAGPGLPGPGRLSTHRHPD